MSLVTLLIAIAAIGLLVWAINAWVPMPASFLRIVNIVAVVGVVLFILYALGILGRLDSVRVPHV